MHAEIDALRLPVLSARSTAGGAAPDDTGGTRRARS
jgi:hypothetical protein